MLRVGQGGGRRLWFALVVLILIALAIAGALVYGASRWHSETEQFRATLAAARWPATPTRYDARELEGLPPPVRRYFGAVLRDGQPMITGARLSQEGSFRLRETQERWGPFRATHMVTIRPPAFDWDARIRWAPGLTMFVRDAYGAGTGTLRAAAFGLITVVDQRGTPELAQGELMRYLAEAVWYPTALLPSQGVRWEPIDDARARASPTDGSTSVSLEFRFDQEGFVTSVWSPARPRDVNGVPTPTPWQAQVRAYTRRAGMRVPLEGEVAWHLPGGPLPYWRGRITEMAYELAP
jgi:hypothetical protein